MNSQWLHHVSLLHPKCKGLPEPPIGLSGCSFLPLFARAGFLVSCGLIIVPVRTVRVSWLCSFLFSRQEGWRLENENPTDANSPLVFKGVVFNEMKGAFVSSHYQHVSVTETFESLGFWLESGGIKSNCMRHGWSWSISSGSFGVLVFFTVWQRAFVRPAPSEQAVSSPHLLCGVRRRTPEHPRPHLGAT